MELRGARAQLDEETGLVTFTWSDPPQLGDPNAVALPQRIITLELGPATVVTTEPTPEQHDELED